jgi:hypothetical protein
VSARIIILNGVGSVGKSSIAKAFQTITTEPFLHIAMDAFIDMLPKGMIGHPDGISFRGGTGSGQANYCHQVWAGDAASDARHAPCCRCYGPRRHSTKFTSLAFSLHSMCWRRGSVSAGIG